MPFERPSCRYLLREQVERLRLSADRSTTPRSGARSLYPRRAEPDPGLPRGSSARMNNPDAIFQPLEFRNLDDSEPPDPSSLTPSSSITTTARAPRFGSTSRSSTRGGLGAIISGFAAIHRSWSSPPAMRTSTATIESRSGESSSDASTSMSARTSFSFLRGPAARGCRDASLRGWPLVYGQPDFYRGRQPSG